MHRVNLGIDLFIWEEAEYTICNITQKMMSYGDWLQIVPYVWSFCDESQEREERHII